MRLIIYKRIIYIPFLCIAFLNCDGQSSKPNSNQQIRATRQIGIPVSIQMFDSLVNHSIKILEIKNSISKDDYIVMIRLFNTVETVKPASESAKKFRNLFFSGYINEASKSIEATLSKGMCYYSKKYDLYIGGKPHQNSQYLILNY